METIADAFAGGVESGNKMIQGMQDTQNYQQDKQLQREALSQKVESQRMLLNEAKTQQTAKLAAQAALQKRQLEDHSANANTLQGILRQQEGALTDVTDPDVRDQLMQGATNTRKQLADVEKTKAEMSKNSLAEAYRFLGTNTVDPDNVNTQAIREYADTAGHPEMKQIADMLESPSYKNSTPEQKRQGINLIRQHYLEATAANQVDADISRLKIATEKADIAREKLAEEKRKNDQVAAGKRDKIEVDKSKVTSKTLKGNSAAEAKEINKIDEKQSKLLLDMGVANPEEKDSSWWKGEFSKLSPSLQARYKRLEEQKTTIRSGFATDRGLTTHATPKGTGTAEDPIIID